MNTAISNVMRRIVKTNTANQKQGAYKVSGDCNYADNYYGDQCCTCNRK